MKIDSYTAKPYWAMFLLLIGYLLLALYFLVFLHYNFLQSDVFDYWQDSLAWKTPYHPFHVPVYALTIALLRGITFDIPSPIAIMMSINLAALLAGAYFVYRIIRTTRCESKFAAMGALLFGLWPFVGLTYAVNPQADLPAISLFLAGLYRLQDSRKLSAACFFGLAIITHKALWPFIGLLVAADFLYRKDCFSRQNILMIGIMLLPLGILWFAGSFYHHSYTWLLSSNLKEELASSSNLPILDGLIGTFLFEEGIKGVLKGFLLMSFALLAVGTIFLSNQHKYQNYFYGIAISLAVLLLFILLNHYEIWAAARFSRLLAIPLVLSVAKMVQDNPSKQLSGVITVLFLILFLSQFAYAWYMARIYFAPQPELGNQTNPFQHSLPAAQHSQYNYAALKPINLS